MRSWNRSLAPGVAVAAGAAAGVALAHLAGVAAGVALAHLAGVAAGVAGVAAGVALEAFIVAFLGEDIFGNAKSRLCYYVAVFLKTAAVACSDLDGRSSCILLSFGDMLEPAN
jgi:hypothetical protein